MPLTRIAPLFGVSRSATARRSVVLPQPDGPMREMNSPRATFRLMLLSASTGPSRVSKRSDTASMSIAASAEGTLATPSRTGDGAAATAIVELIPLSRDAEGGGEFLVPFQRAR